MADEKQSDEAMTLPMETEEESLINDKIFRRTISAPFGNSSESEGDSSVFSASLLCSTKRKSPQDRITSEMNIVRSKSTSTCSRSNSSISDDDSISKSRRRTRTYSDSNQFSSLNVDCSSTSPSPVSKVLFYFVFCVAHSTNLLTNEFLNMVVIWGDMLLFDYLKMCGKLFLRLALRMPLSRQYGSHYGLILAVAMGQTLIK